MKQRMSWWPISCVMLLGILAVMLLFSGVGSIGKLNAEYLRWYDTNLYIHESLWIPGSLLVGASAAIAIMISPRCGICDLQPGNKNRLKAMLYQLAAIIVSAFLGHILGCLPLIYGTAQNATGGHLSWESLLVAFSGITTLSSIGFFIGVGIKRYFIAPVVAVACFLLMGTIREPLLRPLALIFPTHQVMGSARFETNPAVAVFSLIFACLIVITGLAALGLKSGTSNPAAQSQHLSIAKTSRFLPALCVVVLGICAFVWRPELLTVDRPVNTSCFNSDGIEVCLHEQNLPARPAIETAIRKLQPLGMSVFLDKISDDAAADYDAPASDEVLLSIIPGPFDSGFYARNLEETMVVQIVDAITSYPCLGVGATDFSDANRTVAKQFLRRSGYNQLAEDVYYLPGTDLEALNDQQFKDFLVSQKQYILTCSLSLESSAE